MSVSTPSVSDADSNDGSFTSENNTTDDSIEVKEKKETTKMKDKKVVTHDRYHNSSVETDDENEQLLGPDYTDKVRNFFSTFVYLLLQTTL